MADRIRADLIARYRPNLLASACTGVIVCHGSEEGESNTANPAGAPSEAGKDALTLGAYISTRSSAEFGEQVL